MIWGDHQDQDLLTFYQQLIRLRHQIPHSWHHHQRLIIDDSNRVYGYVSGEYAIALNNHGKEITLSLPGWEHSQLTIATDTTTLWNTATAKLSLPPFAGAILSRI
jgi:cyclomaltodextrinase